MRQKLFVAAGCLVCAVVCWKSFLAFEGTEFGGGSLAGNQVLASFLFILALALSFKYPRFAAISALAACVFSLPLYLYLVFPRPFRQVWPGEWKVLELPRETFVWDGWWITGILFTVFVVCLCAGILIRSLGVRNSAKVPALGTLR
ncbi:MAG: hypothetical protein JST11_16855 [Acidobacteria bacterium]|nr:hypothetical protein [Acidobacteriota bacterium]